MKYVGILKSFCNKYKINSPQYTISVESQTENMQNDNTSVSNSEICQNSRTNGERNKRKSKYPKIKSTVIFLQRKICRTVRKNSKSAKRKKSKTAKTRKKEVINQKSMAIKSVQIYKKRIPGEKRKSDGESDIPKKKKKNSK